MDFEKLPERISLELQDAILRDMRPSKLVIHTKLSFAVLCGGIISLALCGQFGFGVTHWAEFMSHSLHERMSPIPCALMCGFLYAIFPSLILRLFLCSPMQFKIILKRNFWSVFGWYFVLGITLAYHGEHGQGILEIGSWIFSAILTSHILEFLMQKFLRGWTMPGLVEVP